MRMRVGLPTSKGQCCDETKTDVSISEKQKQYYVKISLVLYTYIYSSIVKLTNDSTLNSNRSSQGTAPQRRQERAWPTSPCPLDMLKRRKTTSSKTGEASRHSESKQEPKKHEETRTTPILSEHLERIRKKGARSMSKLFLQSFGFENCP